MPASVLRVQEEGAGGGFDQVARAGRVTPPLPFPALAAACEGAVPGWGIIATPLPLRLGPAGL
jgi:hypothetical protein